VQYLTLQHLLSLPLLEGWAALCDSCKQNPTPEINPSKVPFKCTARGKMERAMGAHTALYLVLLPKSAGDMCCSAFEYP